MACDMGMCCLILDYSTMQYCRMNDFTFPIVFYYAIIYNEYEKTDLLFFSAFNIEKKNK